MTSAEGENESETGADPPESEESVPGEELPPGPGDESVPGEELLPGPGDESGPEETPEEPIGPTEAEDLSTGPSTLDDIPDESTSAYRFDAKCSCFVKTLLKTQSAEELLGEELTESPKPEHCDKQGMAECIEFCNRKIKSKTHDFDLNEVPVTENGIDVSLGQYICNQIGSHILPSRMTLYAKLTCTTAGPRYENTASHLATTGVYSKQRLWCVRGKFRPM